jgi:hypothetical protein
MRRLFLVAGLAVAALIPSLASAQQTCEQQRDNRVVGTVAGAGIGALVGSAIAPRGDRTAGALIGGGVGAVVGNQATKPQADCAHAYGYYDRNNQWHANSVDRADAAGYYDRDGAWVDGAPNGYYDGSGQWIAGGADASGNGYSDAHGRWVPASANGYYDDHNTWVSTASGYYDPDGRWIAGQAVGAYDAHGRWMPGATRGYTDAHGVWVADDQLGYYDANHQWRAGETRGYYDARGAWIATSVGDETNGGDIDHTAGHHHDVASREDRLEQRIHTAADDGTLDRDTAHQDLRELGSIRDREMGMRAGGGQLSPTDEAYLQDRLDRLSDSLRASMRNDRVG